jgi:hypothetical protein
MITSGVIAGYSRSHSNSVRVNNSSIYYAAVI